MIWCGVICFISSCKESTAKSNSRRTIWTVPPLAALSLSPYFCSLSWWVRFLDLNHLNRSQLRKVDVFLLLFWTKTNTTSRFIFVCLFYKCFHSYVRNKSAWWPQKGLFAPTYVAFGVDRRDILLRKGGFEDMDALKGHRISAVKGLDEGH